MEISVLDIKGKSSCNQQAIADAFNNYFLSIADTFTENNIHNKIGTKPRYYFHSSLFLKIPLLLRGFNTFQ